MARPRKILEMQKSHLTKKDIEIREQSENKYKVGRNQLSPPVWMAKNEEALAEFNRIVEETAQIDLIDNLDMAYLAIYAQAYSQYVKATLMIAKKGLVTNHRSRNGIITKVSPYVAAQQMAVRQIMQCSAKLGMAVTDRLKLMVPKKNEKPANKFLKYAI